MTAGSPSNPVRDVFDRDRWVQAWMRSCTYERKQKRCGRPKAIVSVACSIGGRHFLAEVEVNIDKDANVIVGCQAGVRSQHAAELMQRAGYTNVATLLGGFGGGRDRMGRMVPGWQAAGLPVSMDNGGGVRYTSLSEKVRPRK